jgi:hypothetical protein
MSEHDRERRERILRRLLGPSGPELSCEECFAQLDHYVELELSGAEAEALVPGMQAHLEGCPACDEDHESLLRFMQRPEAAPAAQPPGD